MNLDEFKTEATRLLCNPTPKEKIERLEGQIKSEAFKRLTLEGNLENAIAGLQKAFDDGYKLGQCDALGIVAAFVRDRPVVTSHLNPYKPTDPEHLS